MIENINEVLREYNKLRFNILIRLQELNLFDKLWSMNGVAGQHIDSSVASLIDRIDFSHVLHFLQHYDRFSPRNFLLMTFDDPYYERRIDVTLPQDLFEMPLEFAEKSLDQYLEETPVEMVCQIHDY